MLKFWDPFKKKNIVAIPLFFYLVKFCVCVHCDVHLPTEFAHASIHENLSRFVINMSLMV